MRTIYRIRCKDCGIMFKIEFEERKDAEKLIELRNMWNLLGDLGEDDLTKHMKCEMGIEEYKYFRLSKKSLVG